VYSDLTTKVSRLFNEEKIMILNTRAELKLEKGDPQACFEDLKLCHRMAISTECSKLKLGELLFNMANACNETR